MEQTEVRKEAGTPSKEAKSVAFAIRLAGIGFFFFLTMPGLAQIISLIRWW